MSKAFEKWWEEFTSAHDEWRFADSDALRKAAWNAATENAAEVCSALGGRDIFGPDENGTEDAYCEAVSDCVEAILKEKTE